MKEKLYDLTAPQRSILVTEQYFKGSSINHICGTAFLYEKIDFDVLEQALNLLVKYNDSLRIRMVLEENEMKQTVNEYVPFNIETVEVSSKDGVSTIEANLMKEPFDMYSNLFTCKMFRMPDGSGGFSVNIHHLVSDSWTLGLVAKEVVRIYSSIIHHEEIDVSSISSYVDYISAEQEYRASDKFKKDKAYWDSVFENIPESASIPSSKEDADSFSCKANRLSFTISKKEMEQINTYCKDAHISAFNFFMGLYAIYTSRVSGIEDFVMGTPILNRTNFKEKNTMGMFINVVPLRLNLTENLSFGEFASRIAKSSFEMMRHQKYSYQYILEDLRKKDASLPNLYHILMSYQITKASEESGVPYDTRWAFNGNVNDDLEIHLYDLNDTGCIDIAYDYRTDKYEESEIRVLHERMLHMIHQVLERKDIGIHEIEIVTSKEKYEILYGFNHISSDILPNNTIIDLFEEQVRRIPNKTAVVFYDTKFTYCELNEKANRLAYYLQTHPLEKEDVIAVFLDKSIEMIISILAILKVGACYLPIDTQYPTSRVNYMLNDSKAKLILASKKTSSLLATDIEIIDVDLDCEFYNSNMPSNILPKSSSSDLAYIMYTSGSTGNPKGVMIEQKSIVRLVKDTNFISFEENDRILQTGSIVFDACTFEIWAALLNGLELYLITKNDLLTVSTFETFLKNYNITILWLTAPLFNQICEQNPSVFKSVRCLLTGGDVLSPKHIRMVKSANPNLTVINGYGPTENTTFSCCFTISSMYDHSIPIGTPITNSSCYVVSKSGNLLPIGVPGELWVGGHGVARGYLNNEALTKKAFVTDFFNSSRVYKTGDLVKWLPDGNIEFIGRIDHQVKIRGFRVELNEINAKILQFSNIRESITITCEHQNDKFICSYVVFQSGNDIEELKDFLKKSLPNYMVPSFIIPLDALPINTNGKVDKKRLPEVDFSVKSTDFVEPSSPSEIKLATIWKDIFHVDKISAHDNFFEIGGDSLLAIKLTSHILSSFGLEVTVSDVFEHPVLSDLANFIGNIKTQKSSIIPKSSSFENYPLSCAQSRIYFANKMEENTTLYNVSGGILIDAILDSHKIGTAFQKLIQIHSSFRTCFKIFNGAPRQVILDHVDFSVEIQYDDEINMADIIDNFPKAFNLEFAPLLRVCVCYLDKKKTLILLDSHHIILDGTSLNILIRDFCKIYNQEVIKVPEIDYKDYTLWEYHNNHSSEMLLKENYWVNMFRDSEIPVINLPYDYTTSSNLSCCGNKISMQISNEVFLFLENIAKEMHCSSYMVFLATFYILLYKYSSQNHIIIGTPSINRTTSNLHDIIGMFVNNIVLNAYIDSTKTFREFLLDIKKLVLESLSNQDYPYDLLIKKLSLNGQNLFDVMFTYQNTERTPFTIEHNPLKIIESNTKTAKFNLSLEIVPDKNTINLEYRTDLLKKETVTNLLTHYISLLSTICTHINDKISDISILSEKEKNQILVDFNNMCLDYPKEKTIPQLFEEQVQKNPNNIAVVFGSTNLTYAELDQKSTYFAYQLYSKGIRQGDVVGVCLNRSIELIVSIISILKLGAIYMPMYVEYPKERLDYMLKDSSAKLLITNSHIQSLLAFCNTIVYCESFDYLTLPFNFMQSFENTSIAYIIYTSGSTGRPKGVQISHRNLINFIYAFKKYFNDITDNDTFLASTNISFDVSIFELFLPILSGAKLILYTEDIIKNIALYCDTIVNYKVTALYIPPNILNEVYTILKDKTLYINKLLVGVESIRKNTLNQYIKLLPNLNIVNAYGPTETTICCTAFPYKFDDSNDDIVTIGRPLYNNQIFILSPDKSLQPIGVSGEIYVAGDGVGYGYINDMKKTNENYIPNTYTSSSSTMYKTGDLAKWNPDGTIQFIGRNDAQVKISGHRIELSEISYMINSFPNITKSFCTTYHLGNNIGIVGYFTATKTISIKDLTAFLKHQLANYMVPNFMMQLENFPLTPNGKIDKKSLPKNFITLSENYVSPRNEFEETVSDIWKNLLGIERISITDNFFDLGGDSLLAIKFQLEALKLGLNITYSDIFTYPTIKQLSERNTNIDANSIFMKNHHYDFSKIHNLINNNCIDNIKNCAFNNISPIGNILLIGATGFLGAHILDSYLSTSTGIAYCLIRMKDGSSPEQRLKKILTFYFGNKYKDSFGKRIIVINGDMTKEQFGLNATSYNSLGENINVVINSAALVKHYGDYQLFNNTNVLGTSHIIHFCKKFCKKLYHISTLSVSGSGLDESPSKDITSFSENNFYIGQNLNNMYIYTKFEAEKLIFEEILSGTLSACILRIGNISNRFSDGKFQINVSENAFANRFKSIVKLGILQKEFLEHFVELTPVDICSNAIMKIIRNNSDFCVFHLFNPNLLKVDKLLTYLADLDIHISPVEDSEFSSRINSILSNDTLRSTISGIITDLDDSKLLNLIASVVPNCDFTQCFLNHCGFEWPEINNEYIEKYINYFNSIKFLEA